MRAALPTAAAIEAQLGALFRRLEQLPAVQEPERPRPVVIQELEHSTVWMAPVDSIAVRPDVFQFRLATAGGGTCGRLKGLEKYNPALAGALLVWRAPEGCWCLVDGHHRLELAKRCGVQRVAVLAIDAADPIEARTIGAMANLANNQAGAIELARLLRDTPGLSSYGLNRDYGVTLNTRPMEAAAELRKLDADLFTQAANGVITLAHALALCGTEDHSIQRQAWAMALARGWDPTQLTEAIALAELSPKETIIPAGVLPGLEDLMRETNALLDEQLSVRAEVRRQLQVERRAGRVAANSSSAAALERTGAAVVDPSRAKEMVSEAKGLLTVFSALAGAQGPLAVLLNQLAQQLADGADLRRLVAAEMETIRRHLSAALV